MSAYFITATGTGIGKTFVTCALIHAARARGIPIHAYKPVISGFDENNLALSDTAKIIEALGLTMKKQATRDFISPLRFKAPLSPHMAALREDKTIDFSALIDWSKSRLAANHYPNALALIEGVGGAMVPLNDMHTVRDWMAALHIPVILVTGSYLGSISHTLTTLEALRVATIPVAAIVLCESEDSTVSLQETFTTLNDFAHDTPLRIMQPRVSSFMHATAIHAMLEQLL